MNFVIFQLFLKNEGKVAIKFIEILICISPIIPVIEFVNGHGHVSWLFRARIKILVIFRKKVNVVENKTIELFLFQCLNVADIH